MPINPAKPVEGTNTRTHKPRTLRNPLKGALLYNPHRTLKGSPIIEQHSTLKGTLNPKTLNPERP